MTRHWSANPYRSTVASIIDQHRPTTLLDVACGDGWLGQQIGFPCVIDGVDFYYSRPHGYRSFFELDINAGLPDSLPLYNAVVCCEAIAYLENPGLSLRSIQARMSPGGVLVLSSPNPNYAGARFHFLVRGQLPGFSHFLQNEKHEAHMPWLPLAWPQFWLLLGLVGFSSIQLHEVEEPKPKHFWEKLIGAPAQVYCHSRACRAQNHKDAAFWQRAGSDQGIYGRRLMVSAIAN